MICMKRKIITIDRSLCDGCGNCIPNCPEGAIQIIDEKARIISDIFCDGLGACIGYCPKGAISIEEREAEPYDEKKVMREKIIPSGENTILAHLNHLKDHGEKTYINQALEVLNEQGINIEVDKSDIKSTCTSNGCPGAKAVDFSSEKSDCESDILKTSSQLKQWPIQLHLISPQASYIQESDVILVADCVAYSMGNFHNELLQGKRIAIACPKLDRNIDQYIDKLTMMIDQAKINTLTIINMEVPCCSGLLTLATKALENATRNIPIKHIMISIKGEKLKEQWI